MNVDDSRARGRSGRRVPIGLLWALASVVLAAACASKRVPAAPAPRAAFGSPLPDPVHWLRNSAEYEAAARQAFRLAGRLVRERADGRAPGTWGVISDADETLIDNSLYQKERAALGLAFTPESWRAWCARRAAGAVPGALEFAAEVRALGGRLVVVTNRTDEECPDTEANFRDLGLAVDATLCRPRGAPSAKDVRFAQVRTGAAAPGLGPLEVLLYLGDNILDFPGLDQGARGQSARLAEFGASYVIVPNPMYGSWLDNPRR